MAEPCGWGPTPQGVGSGVGNSHPTRLALLATLLMKGREGADDLQPRNSSSPARTPL